MCNTCSSTRDSFLTLLPSSLRPGSVVSVVLLTFWFHCISFLCKRNLSYEGYGLSWGEGWDEAALLLIYVLITVYKYIYVYRNSHNLYFHWCVQYVSGFDSCVLKTVCRYLLGLCIVWSWDLMGQFAQWGFVCVCVSRSVFCMYLVPLRYSVGRASGPHEGT